MSQFRRIWSRQFDQYSSVDNYQWEIQLARCALGIGGIWPDSGKRNGMRFFISLTIIFVFLTSPQLITLFSFENESQLFSSISGIIFRSYLMISMFLLRSNSKVCRSILEEIQAHWLNFSHKEDRKIMDHYAGGSRKISLIIAANTCFAVISKFLPPLIHAIISGREIKTVPGHSWYPFSLSHPFILASCYISEVIAINVISFITVGIDICLTVFIFHTCAQLAILGSRIKKHEGQLRHPSGDDVLQNCSCLKCIVDSHVRICEFVKRIDNYFHLVLFLRLCLSVFYFCCVAFVVLKAIETKTYRDELMISAVLTFSACATLLLYCWLGEMCRQRGDALGDIVYSSEWMTKESKISRDLIFIIRHTRIPLKITAANFFVFSLTLFKEFIVTSLSYLSVLITIQQTK